MFPAEQLRARPVSNSSYSGHHILQLDSRECRDVCYYHSHQGSSPLSAWCSTWTDVWRVYEDVCMMCAGLWMGAWRNASTPALAGLSRRPDSWSNARLEGDDDFAPRPLPSEAHVRTLGQGIESRLPGGTLPAGRARSSA